MTTEAQPSSRSPLLQPFYPALDGFRAISFLMVFFYHYGGLAHPWRPFNFGWAGVDFFFVLSGFLITGILYDSLHRGDFFRNFYIRRALRIFPLFYGLWIAALILTPFLHFTFNRYNLAMAAYLGNFFFVPLALSGRILALDLAFGHGTRHYIHLTPLWSLCVEEQFYLLWPLVVYKIRSRKTLIRICLTIILIAPFLRLVWLHLFPLSLKAGGIFVNSFFRIDTLLFGAVLALWLRGPSPTIATLRRTAWIVVVAAPATLAACLIAYDHKITGSIVDPIIDTVGFTLIALTAAALILLAIDPATHLNRWLQIRPLVFLGRLSYGMYILHGLPSTYLWDHVNDFARRHISYQVLAATCVYTFVAAWLSFRFLESPFLALKSKLAPRRGAVNDPPPAHNLHTPPPPLIES